MNWFSKKLFREKSVSGASGTTNMPKFMARTSRSNDLQDPAFPHFSGSASDLTRTAKVRGMDLVRQRLREAFTPSQPVSDVRKFAGRRDILINVIRAIEDQQVHVVVYGDRGIGKTSLLWVIEDLSRKADYIVHYQSCGEGSDFGEVFRVIASHIPLLYHRSFDPTTNAIEEGKTLADLLPPGPLNVSQVSDVFSKISGTRVLVILDEFDRSDSEKFRRPVAELIKNLSDRSVRVQLLIAGVASNLTELISHIPSIRRNIAGIPVPIMQPDEIADIIRIGERQSGLAYEPGVLDIIAGLASGSPYIASLLGQHAGLVAAERRSASVQQRDVSAATRLVYDELRLRLSPRSLHTIELVDKIGYADKLGELGRMAMIGAGRLEAGQLATVLGTKEVVHPLDSIIERIPDDPANAYRFVEDGLSQMLWIRHMVEKL